MTSIGQTDCLIQLHICTPLKIFFVIFINFKVSSFKLVVKWLTHAINYFCKLQPYINWMLLLQDIPEDGLITFLECTIPQLPHKIEFSFSLYFPCVHVLLFKSR